MTEEKNIPADKAPLETSYSARSTAIGDMVVGTIVKVMRRIAFVDFGGRNQGYIELSELKDGEGNLVVNEGEELRRPKSSVPEATQLSYRKAQVELSD